MRKPTDSAYGLCECGCGERTNLAPQTSRKFGRVKGEPFRFIKGHHSRIPKYVGCTVDGCDGKHETGGLCGKHYMRLRQTGTTELRKFFSYDRICSACGRSWNYTRTVNRGAMPQRCPSCRVGAAREYQREWARKHREKTRESKRRWREDNIEQMAEARAAWEQTHRDVRRGYQRVRDAQKRQALSIARFTPEQLRLRLSVFGNQCWMCGGEAKAVDHVKPLSRGGSHLFCNLRPACQSCNSRKGGQWPFPSSYRGVGDALTGKQLLTA